MDISALDVETSLASLVFLVSALATADTLLVLDGILVLASDGLALGTVLEHLVAFLALSLSELIEDSVLIRGNRGLAFGLALEDLEIGLALADTLGVSLSIGTLRAFNGETDL